MDRTSGELSVPQWIRNNIIDFQRAIPMKILIENGKICNQTMMRKRLGRFGEV